MFIDSITSPSAKAAGFSSRSPAKRSSKRSRCRVPLFGVLALLLLGGIGYRQVHAYIQEPQAILVLGGAVEREAFAAEFAQQHPDLEIWVSSGSNPEYARWAFAEAGIAPERVHLDYRAVDTVTNFTTLVDDFEALGITSIYLVTSDYHMRRAQVIGEIVLGSRGISYKPLEVPSERSPETLDKAMRDAARAILWVTTGHTGSELHKYFPTRAQSK